MLKHFIKYEDKIIVLYNPLDYSTVWEADCIFIEDASCERKAVLVPHDEREYEAFHVTYWCGGSAAKEEIDKKVLEAMFSTNKVLGWDLEENKPVIRELGK